MTPPKNLEETLRIRALRRNYVDYKACEYLELNKFYRQRTGSLRRGKCKNWLVSRLRRLDLEPMYPFRFLSLPSEVRNQIYELVLPYNPECCPVKNRTALLLACHQTHQEGSPIFYQLSAMTLRVSAYDHAYTRENSLRHSWEFSGDIHAFIRSRSIFGLYTSKLLCALPHLRNLKLIIRSHLGPDSWLVFFTYLAHSTTRLKRLQILFDTDLSKHVAQNWWYKDPAKVAEVLSPLRKAMQRGVLLYFPNINNKVKAALDKRLGLQAVDQPGRKLFKVWNVIQSRWEMVPRFCLGSE